ncbi:hypothetical protein BKA83DRAFT_4345466 [Pisolithus microcarpus]|nr:hypothetical protein BKA83DRAFT_4345466 [Pisolithus microcarpus]
MSASVSKVFCCFIWTSQFTSSSSTSGNFDGLRGKINRGGSTDGTRCPAHRCLATRMSSSSGTFIHFVLCFRILLMVLRSTP